MAILDKRPFLPIASGLTKHCFCVLYIVFSVGLCAGVAQLVEHKLPKLGVASSNLVARSRVRWLECTLFYRLYHLCRLLIRVALKVGLPAFFYVYFKVRQKRTVSA